MLEAGDSAGEVIAMHAYLCACSVGRGAQHERGSDVVVYAELVLVTAEHLAGSSVGWGEMGSTPNGAAAKVIDFDRLGNFVFLGIYK